MDLESRNNGTASGLAPGQRCCVGAACLMALRASCPLTLPTWAKQQGEPGSTHCTSWQNKGCLEGDAMSRLSLSAGPKLPAAITREKSRLSANTIFCLWSWKGMWWTQECCKKKRGACMSSEAFLWDLNIPFSKLKKATLFVKFNALTWSIFRR